MHGVISAVTARSALPMDKELSVCVGCRLSFTSLRTVCSVDRLADTTGTITIELGASPLIALDVATLKDIPLWVPWLAKVESLEIRGLDSTLAGPVVFSQGTFSRSLARLSLLMLKEAFAGGDLTVPLIETLCFSVAFPGVSVKLRLLDGGSAVCHFPK